MISSQLLLLILAFIPLICAVNGGDADIIHADALEANNVHNPHSFSRHILPSRTILNEEDKESQMFRSVEPMVNVLSPASSEKQFTHSISQEEYAANDEGELDTNETPYSDSHVWFKRSMPGAERISKPNSRERYFRMLQQRPLLAHVGQGTGNNNNPNHAWTSNDLKRERSNGATLSVESSLDLIRQKFIQELRRRQIMEKQKQIESNGDLLSTIGKRGGYHSLVNKH